MESNDRAIRQRDLVPPAALADYHAIVVGVGAIGRQVALQLAVTGIPVMTLFDDDTVAIENLAVQGYRPADLGLPKVRATEEACRALYPEIVISAEPVRLIRGIPILPQRAKLAVFACVDSMIGRRTVWQALHGKAAFYADGRMAGEVLRVLASGDPPVDTSYPQTLFQDAQAHPAPCTGRSTLYAASIAAGLMVCRFAMHLRGQMPTRDVLVNLAADEWVVL